MKEKIIYSIAFLIVVLGGYFYFQDNLTEKTTVKVEEAPKQEEKKEIEKPKEPEIIIKEETSLEVPYTVQAPLVNWNIHDESCEEAVSLMAHHFILGDLKGVIDKNYSNTEMIKMKDWQVKNYGKEPDLTIEGLGQFIKSYYGHEFSTAKNITKDDIKRELSKGQPIIVPVMTHSLKNPHYGVENSYHVLLVKGYKADGVIANDPGVAQGKDYFYTWEILFNAIDAQTPKMGQGREMVIIGI